MFPPKKTRLDDPPASKPEAKESEDKGDDMDLEEDEDVGRGRGSGSLTSVVVVPSASQDPDNSTNNKDKPQVPSAISTVGRTPSASSDSYHRDPRRRNSGEDKHDRHDSYDRRDNWGDSSSSSSHPPHNRGGGGGRGPPPPDEYMSDRDRWAYEMAKQQYFKDMYGREAHNPRRPVPQQNYDRSYYPRHWYTYTSR